MLSAASVAAVTVLPVASAAGSDVAVLPHPAKDATAHAAVKMTAVTLFFIISPPLIINIYNLRCADCYLLRLSILLAICMPIVWNICTRTINRITVTTIIST